MESAKQDLLNVTNALYSDLDRSQDDKTEDFTLAVKSFLAGFLSTQKQVIIMRC